MDYMVRHGEKRTRPAKLVNNTQRIICVAMNYWSGDKALEPIVAANQKQLGIVSRYALGRDYHKVLRQRLKVLAKRIEQHIGPFGYRVFTDSAPVMEKALAEKAGLGWVGKHTNLINSSTGSWFFLGELYTDLPLPIDEPASNHCGSCRSCIDVCPTGAIVSPYRLDARLCISYLTIELRTSIPEKLRTLIGNRIFGCDDCQAVCPWNRFAKVNEIEDFNPRDQVTDKNLVWFSSWSEQEFLQHTEGSAIRRVGYLGWLRNVAVALGNANSTADVIAALKKLTRHESSLVREHAYWGLEQHSAAG